MVATTTNRHRRGTTDRRNGTTEHGDTQHKGTAGSGTADAGTDVRVPSPRQGDGQDWHVMLRKGPDGAVWLMIEGEDLAHVAARLGAVRDALNRARQAR